MPHLHAAHTQEPADVLPARRGRIARSHLPHGPARPFSRFARAGLTRAGHLPAQQKIAQLQALGGRLFACGPSIRHFHVAKDDLAFPGVIVAEYLTFMEALARADIQLFIQ